MNNEHSPKGETDDLSLQPSLSGSTAGLFINLEPFGFGIRFMESLTSYIGRLAKAYHVEVTNLEAFGDINEKA